MKLLKQTKFHNPPITNGNCFATVIATLIEVEVKDVPAVEEVFKSNNKPNENKKWVNIMQEYLNSKGYLWGGLDEHLMNDELYIAVGPSPRGNFNHCVIYKNGKLFHDPHPDNTGLKSITHLEVIEKLD